jgi:hypothetical protein
MRFKFRPLLPQFWAKIAAFLLLAVIVALIGLLFDRYQTQQRHQTRETISRINSAWLTSNYQDCINQAQQVTPDSPIYQESQMLSQFCQNALDQEKLEQARALAAADQLERAIGVANSISAASSHFAAAQQEVENWSVPVWALAQRLYGSSTDQLNLAITTANSIPENCSLYLTVQQQIQQWQQTWQNNQHHWRAAEVAIEMNDLDKAATALAQIIDHPYWDLRVQPLMERIQAKQQQYEILVMEIQQHLQENDLNAARQKTSQLPLTGTWGEKRAELTKAIDRAEKKPTIIPTETVIGILLLLFEALIEIGARHK